jgi:hypothetical protein
MFFKTLHGNQRLMVARLSKKSHRKGNGRTGWYQPADGSARFRCWFDWDRKVFIEAGTVNIVLEYEPTLTKVAPALSFSEPLAVGVSRATRSRRLQTSHAF